MNSNIKKFKRVVSWSNYPHVTGRITLDNMFLLGDINNYEITTVREGMSVILKLLMLLEIGRAPVAMEPVCHRDYQVDHRLPFDHHLYLVGEKQHILLRLEYFGTQLSSPPLLV